MSSAKAPARRSRGCTASEAYNESDGFWKAVYRYRDRYGRWPERILEDKIYRKRQTSPIRCSPSCANCSIMRRFWNGSRWFTISKPRKIDLYITLFQMFFKEVLTKQL